MQPPYRRMKLDMKNLKRTTPLRLQHLPGLRLICYDRPLITAAAMSRTATLAPRSRPLRLLCVGRASACLSLQRSPRHRLRLRTIATMRVRRREEDMRRGLLRLPGLPRPLALRILALRLLILRLLARPMWVERTVVGAQAFMIRRAWTCGATRVGMKMKSTVWRSGC